MKDRERYFRLDMGEKEKKDCRTIGTELGGERRTTE